MTVHIIPRFKEKPLCINKKKSIELYKLELKEHTDKLICIDDVYLGSNEKIKHQYVDCGHVIEMTPGYAFSGKFGCRKCSSKELSDRMAFSHEEYLEEISIVNPTIRVLGKYVNRKTRISHLCTIHNVIWDAFPESILRGGGCKLCCKEKIGKKFRKTDEKYLSDLQQVHPYIIPIEQYVNALTKIKHRCKICNYEWDVTPGSLLTLDFGCPCCAHKQASINRRYSLDEYKDILARNNPNVEIVGEYLGTMTPTSHKCVVCGFIWNAYPGNIIKGHGCPLCSLSFGEKKIANFFDVNNVSYEVEKTFPNLLGVGNGFLSYDFYIPISNCLIEYQGKQHEKSVYYFGGKEQLIIQQEHDRRKREYAKQHGFKLLEIWYYDYDNIEKILKDNLNLLSVETTGII